MKNLNDLIPFPDGNYLKMVSPEEIIRLEASGCYTIVYLSGGDTIIVCKNMGHLLETIKLDSFIRVHHSHIVNLAYVTSFQKKGHSHALLKDGTKIEVSRRKKKEVWERLQSGMRTA